MEATSTKPTKTDAKLEVSRPNNKKNPNKIKDPTGDKVYYVIVYVLLSIFLVIIMYPLWFIVVASVSDPIYVNRGDLLLYPKGFDLLGYQKVFAEKRIWTGYGNTIIYTVGGTAIGLFTSILAGYGLSRKDLPYRNILMTLFVITMYFGGGLIPTYLWIKDLHLLNTRLLMCLLGTTTVHNIILIRSYFSSSLPPDLYEAASIDGCTNQRFFFSIALPLSQAIVAVIALYIAVGQWNAYFNPMIYLQNKDLKPLQLVLRDLLTSIGNSNTEQIVDPEQMELMNKLAEVMKYGVIIVSTLPMLVVYPFVQRYFVKGVMIGSIKG